MLALPAISRTISYLTLIAYPIVLLHLILCASQAHAQTMAAQSAVDDSFYMTKICRKVNLQDEDGMSCEDGYVLKSERLANGKVRETIVMDNIPATLWYRTTLKQLDNDTYLMHLSCGNYCGSNTLIGRGEQQQDFGWWFTYDVASRCSAEFDSEKMLWVARPFFSNKIINLPKTVGTLHTATELKYTAEFTKNGQLAISEFMARQPKFILPNPCTAAN